MESFLQDVRYALRTLRARPGFAAVAVLTLAIGIGLNASVFTVVDAALLRALPYAEPERLVHLWQVEENQERTHFPFAWQTLRDLQASPGVFASVGGYAVLATVWSGRAEPEELPALHVSSNFFEVLGVRPALGRTFLPGEDELGGPHAVVLTDAFWRTRLGGDPDILGKTLTFAGEPTTVVGVLPPSFPFAPAQDARVVLAAQPRGDFAAPARHLNWIRAVARLRDGVSLAEARKSLASFEDALRERFPVALGGVLTDVTPLRDELVGRMQPVLVLLFVCVSLVLLVSCVNVANLLLARAAGRRKEISVRIALGAGRGRLVRQLLTESLLLSIAGGALGLVAAWLSLPLLLSGIPGRDRAGMPFLQHLGVDGRVATYGLAVVLLSTVLFGLLPALRASRPDVHDVLEEGEAAGAGPFRHSVRDLLVCLEVGLAVMLLGSAGLMGKSLVRVLSTDPGFRPRGVLGIELARTDQRVQDPATTIAARSQLLQAIEGVPGVSAAARVSRLPGTGSTGTRSFVRLDQPRPAGAEPTATAREVSPGYFRTLGLPLLAGRDFGPVDTLTSTPVVIVNRALQRRYFPGEDALGKTIRPLFSPTGAALTIVGVVGDQTLGGLDDDPPAILYLPDTQSVPQRTAVVVRVDRPGVGPELRQVIRQDAPTLVVGPVRALDDVLRDVPSMFLRRYPVFLLAVFAGVALLLACIGIFGVVSFGVAQRTREFGIRMAMGAIRRDIVRLVLGGSSAPVVVGIAGGLAGAVGLATVFRGLLYGVASSDPVVLGGVAGVLALVAVVSALLPAVRAARVDPAVALRSL